MLKISWNSIVILLTSFACALMIATQADHRSALPSTLITSQEYLKQFTLIQFTPQGTLKDKLTAEFWDYKPKQKQSYLKKPQLQSYQIDGSYYQIKAQTGYATHETLQSQVTLLDLQDNVLINKINPVNDNSSLKITTEHLQYLPEQQFVQTNKFVKMIKPNIMITGTGLRGNLDSNHIFLLSDVNTHYEANKT